MSNLWDSLEDYATRCLGPDAPQLLLVILSAAAARMGKPVAVRTVGLGRQHDLFRVALTKLLGERLLLITSLTPAGLVRLQPHGRDILAFELEPYAEEAKSMAMITRLVEERPIHHIEAGRDNTSCIRKLSCTGSVLLLRGEWLQDNSVLSRVLSIRFQPNRGYARHDAEVRLRHYASEGHDEPSFAMEDRLAAARLNASELNWQCSVCFDGVTSWLGTSTHVEQTDRLEILLRLAGAYVLLKTSPSPSLQKLQGTRDDLDFIVDLLARANVSEPQESITTQALAFLQGLQRDASELCRTLPSGAPAKDRPATPGFTMQDLQKRYPSRSHATLYGYLRELAEWGLVERCGRCGRADLWVLTERGANHRRHATAEVLRAHLGSSE